MLYGRGHVKYTVHNSGAYCHHFLPGNRSWTTPVEVWPWESRCKTFGRRKVILWTCDSTIRNSTIRKTVHVHLHCPCVHVHCMFNKASKILNIKKRYMYIYTVHVYMYIVSSVKQVHMYCTCIQYVCSVHVQCTVHNPKLCTIVYPVLV